MAKIGETIGIGNKIVRFDVYEIYSVESAIKWLETRLKESNFDIEYYSCSNLKSYHDGGFKYTVDTFDELMIYINRYKSDGISAIDCKFKYKGESVWLLMAIERSSVGLMIHLDSGIDVDELAKELGLI